MHSSAFLWYYGLAFALFLFSVSTVEGDAGVWTLSGPIMGASVLGSPLALEVYNNKLYAAFRGTDSQLYLGSSSDGINWPSAATLISLPSTDNTANMVALRTFGSHMFMAIEGENSRMWLAAYNGSWTMIGQEAGFSVLGSPMSMDVFQNSLYVAFRGTDSNLYWLSSPDGFSWATAATIIPSGGVSLDQVALRTFGSHMFMAVQGENNLMWIGSYDGNSWTLNQETSASILGSPVALEVYNNALFAGFRGTDSRLYLVSSTDGATWPGAAAMLSLPSTAITLNPIALRTFNSMLLIAFQGEDNRMYLATTGASSSSSYSFYPSGPLLFGFLCFLPATVALLSAAF